MPGTASLRPPTAHAMNQLCVGSGFTGHIIRRKIGVLSLYDVVPSAILLRSGGLELGQCVVEGAQKGGGSGQKASVGHASTADD
jgi:hypothetical protein